MATRPPSLHDFFIGRPLQTQSDVAYSNILDERDPNRTRKANVVGRELGLPGATVSADVNGFEQEAYNHKALDLLGADPHLATFVADPHNAASVKDDLPSLASISSLLGTGPKARTNWSFGAASKPDFSRFNNAPGAVQLTQGHDPQPLPATPGNVGRGLAASIVGGTAEGILGTVEGLLDNLGLGEKFKSTDWYRRNAYQAYRDQQLSNNLDFKPVGRIAGIDINPQAWAFGAASSIGQLGLAALTGNPVTAFGAVAGGQFYRTARQRGASVKEATGSAIAYGGIESATEAIEIPYLLNQFGKKGTGKFIAGLLGREIPGELTATAGENLVDAMTTGGVGWEQYKKNLPADLLNTVGSTALTVGALGAGSYVRRRVARETRAIDDIERAQAGAEFVDSLMNAADTSKVKEQDPETLKQFIDQRTQDSPVRNVYVPVEAAVAYMQSEQYGGELDRYQDQIDQAQQTQGDVVIPIGDAVAHLSGTPAWDALREEVRVEPGGLSRKEATKQHAEIIEQLETRGKEIAKDVQDAEGPLDSSAEVYVEVKNRLRIAGVDDRQADAAAQIYAARYEARAARRGGTPMEQFKASKISFPGEQQGRPAGREVAQSVVNIGLNIQEGRGGKVDVNDAIKALKAQGVDVLDTQVRQSATDPTLIARLSKPLTAKQGHAVSAALQQEAIAQRTGEKGKLFGPQAAKWGPFNSEHFLDFQAAINDADQRQPHQDVLPEAGWTPERVSGLIDQFGNEDGSSTAVAVMMSPSQYLAMNASAAGREMIAQRVAEMEAYGGALDVARLQDSPPIYLGVALGGENDTRPPPMVRGHNGRHRMELLRQAGIERVPVIVALTDKDGKTKSVSEPIKVSNIVPNRSRSSQMDTGDLTGEIEGVPISWKYQDQLTDMGQRVLFQTIKLRGFGSDARRAPDFEVGQPNPLNNNERIINGGGVTIKPFGENWRISDLRAVQRGGGRRALERVIREADALGITLELSAVPLESPAGKKMKKAELIAWYKTFGFSGPADKMVREPEERTFDQGPRGSTTFTDDGSKLIQLFASANRSTLLHETGHIWLEELKADATAPDATEQDKTDWETVKAWFASQGQPVVGEFIPTEAHEFWARGVERYFMEGKSPSTKLAGVFRTFKSWLLKIYSVVQNLNTPITPEIREVMDRLIATQDAIDDARRLNATEPLFKSAEEAQMTDAEFADYQARIANARDEAYDALLFKTMEKLRRERTEEMRSQKANIRAEVAEQINKQPQFRLLHLLRTGKWLGDPDRTAQPVKLNTGWLIDNYGEDILNKLPRGIQIWAGAGETGDVVAEMVGLGSGAEVVHTLVGMRAASDELRRVGETRSMRDKLIAEETDRIMAERHGDALTDGSIEEEAVAAINSARQGEIIASEARQLAKRKHVLGVPTPYQFAREWAKRTIGAGHVRDVASRSALQRYIRATNKSARAAEEAILAGDVDEAYRQKQAQLLNHALLAEAKGAADRVDKIIARMRRLAVRAAMKSVDPAYMERVHQLLEDYDFRPRSQRSIDEQEGFQEWLERQRAKGFEVHIPPRLENNGTPYSRVSVQELESLNDLVESLIAVGRTKQKIKIAQKERDFSEFRDNVVARIQALSDRKLPPKPINEETRWIASKVSEYLKVETIAEELDGGPTGPLHDVLVLGATEAENLRHDLRHQVMVPLAQSYKALGRKYWRRLQERVTIPELTWNTLNEGDPRMGSPVTITRSELLSVFMNMGNLSNLEKLSKGERWPVETLRAVMDRELTKEDYDFAQLMWDKVEELWPAIVKVEQELSGIVPEKVVNAPIATRFGDYRGGYWPVVYDASRWQVAEDLEGKQLDDMFGMKSGVATQKGHTVSRTGAFGPINLSLERVLFNHLEQVVTRIAYAPYARDVLRTVRDRVIRGWIDTKLGPEYRKQIEPWLARQIHQGHPFPKGARYWDGMLRQFRINMTIASMGFRMSTGAAQVLGLTASAQRIGAKWVGVGMKRLAAHPREAARFAYAKSPELYHRTEAVNREVAEVANRMRQKHKWWGAAQHWAMWHIGMIDRYFVALPTWLGAYEKGTSEGMTDPEAVAYADKSVRMSQGTGREKDMSAVQSPNSEASRFFTMFYTPFNVMFNAQWQGARGLKAGNVRPMIAVTFWWMMMSTLGDALMSGDWPEFDDPENIGEWFARNVFFGLWAGIPIARDLANYGERKLMGQYVTEPGNTPITRVADAINQAWDAGKRKVVKGEDPQRPIKMTGDLTAILLGVPTSQLGATGQFAWDVHEGKQDPKSVSDWYFGITKGKVPKKDEETEQ